MTRIAHFTPGIIAGPQHPDNHLELPRSPSAFGLSSSSLCYVSSGNNMGGGGGQPKIFQPSKGFPKIIPGSNPAPSSTVRQDLQKVFPQSPIQVTAISRPLETVSPTTPALAAGHIVVAGDMSDGVNLLEIPDVNVMFIPQWHADAGHGGGARGGVAQSAYNHASKLRQESNEAAATALEKAMGVYESERDRQVNGAFQLGTVVHAKVQVPDGVESTLPGTIAHVASVPPAHLRHDRDISTQADRMLYVSNILREMLRALRDKIVAQDTELQSRKDKPIRVALPMVCTGPEGAVTLEECAVVMLSEIGEFCKENPGYEFVVSVFSPYRGDWRKAGEYQRFTAIMAGDSEALIQANQIRPRTPRQIFEETIAVFQQPIEDGVVFDRAYFDSKFEFWKNTFCQKLAAGSVENPKKISERFATNPESLLASKLFRYASLSNGKITDNGFEAPTITAEILGDMMKNEGLAQSVFSMIYGTLNGAVRTKFGGTSKIDEIMASALAEILEENAGRIFQTHWRAFSDKIRTQSQELAKLEQQTQTAIDQKLAAEREKEQAEEEARQQQIALDIALKKVVSKERTADMLRDALQEQTQTNETEIKGLLDRLREQQRLVAEKATRISQLEADISNLQSRIDATQFARTSNQTRSSSFGSSYGRGG